MSKKSKSLRIGLPDPVTVRMVHCNVCGTDMTESEQMDHNGSAEHQRLIPEWAINSAVAAVLPAICVFR